jgi:peptidoglycan/LPS O-acetylase OafA/YrhL
LLDSLRGLAALAVVFTHVLSLGPELAPEVWRLLDATPLRAVHTGRAPVVFFFVLSGYVLALSLLRPDAPGPAVFALRRSLRLLLPVAGAVLLSAALRALFYREPILDLGWDLRHLWAEPVGPLVIARQALLLGAGGWFTLDIPLWSLVHEWRLSLLFPLVLLFRRRVALLLAAALALHAAAVAAGAPPGAAQLGPRLASTLLTSAYFVLPFAAGAALALGGGRLALRRSLARWAAWAGVALASALPWDPGTIAGSVALIMLARGPGFLPRALAAPALLWLGRVSFSLYLVHMPVLAAAVHATHGWLSSWAALAIGVLVSLLVAAGFHAWVEAPAHRLSRRVGARGATAPTVEGEAARYGVPGELALRRW